jgi:polysaccharide export outer membrane protein
MIQSLKAIPTNTIQKCLRWMLIPGLLFFSHQLFAQKIQPGDGVRLTFYNIPDAESGDYFVQQDGNIQLPYVGLVATLERSFKSIQEEIIEKYRSIYRDPELTVQPLYKINVLGEVNKPGMYFVTGVEVFSDLIALAGGETPDANLGKVLIIREEQKIEIDAREVLQKGRKLQEIGLQSGDQVYVSRKKILGLNNATVWISLAALVVTTIGIASNN